MAYRKAAIRQRRLTMFTKASFYFSRHYFIFTRDITAMMLLISLFEEPCQLAPAGASQHSLCATPRALTEKWRGLAPPYFIGLWYIILFYRRRRIRHAMLAISHHRHAALLLTAYHGFSLPSYDVDDDWFIWPLRHSPIYSFGPVYMHAGFWCRSPLKVNISLLILI